MANTLPLVSCIMPTYNRREFVPDAIRYFLRQDYTHKELIIIDDGTDAVQDLVPQHPAIRYYRLDNKITLGAKLNMACQYAAGPIIVNWDDDDWYAERRLRYQVDALQQANTDVCGINQLLYYDLRHKTAYKYSYPVDQRVWLLGSSLCYTKASWQRNPFADINVGMDGLFVWNMSADRVTVLPDVTFSVHMIHNNNVSPKQTEGNWWHTYPVEEIVKVMGEDWAVYNSEGLQPVEEVPLFTRKATVVTAPAITGPVRRLQNVYACLVHENEDCIIDLVRNLHYQDEQAHIILYNGGQNPALFRSKFPYAQYNAVIHPDPVPARYGYLHSFALSCMAFALKKTTFDVFTIVDSDQLALKKGYTEHISAYLHQRPHVGMLSSKAEQLYGHTDIYPATLAFKEYELWKPLLQQFPDGESKFLHWTFWPSTVFTVQAIRDLVQLFKENALLQHIMSKSGIWATEEIVLPTLTRLLGYEIATNPCSYDYVKYKRDFNLHDLQHALQLDTAYWIHPVPRRYDNPLRTQLRTHLKEYTTGKHIPPSNNQHMEAIYTTSILQRIRNIEGWLDDAEAELLMSTSLKACIETEGDKTVVEIGSYQGKSTVLLGSVMKTYFPKGMVYAIDPHGGVVGAADQRLESTAPTLAMCKRNIAQAGVSDVVTLIQAYSFDVAWDKPVSYLFIDGLHDYVNVARDFWHYAGWLQPGAYIAFHDYAHYYPGVQAFVNELLASNQYRKVALASSLMVIQKTGF
ncbi:Methyltransferase domain-containing protein [Filimonas lacunae]|uniref:Methyltransferase domain-containing protein n=1 Tax=Filimonas lacunae TaxID=477680 RepID=A0A173MGN7_9BACT|nr:glycosyltransferase [Filimonas lacunae]BAV06591.1 glycosyltransferases [Filimonas lacunae]SIT27501.1 Methyltransferase domain-containing protein [Filimonas lacunae]